MKELVRTNAGPSSVIIITYHTNNDEREESIISNKESVYKYIYMYHQYHVFKTC
jgi:hypothetical protein